TGSQLVNTGRVAAGAGDRLRLYGRLSNQSQGVVDADHGEMDADSLTNLSGGRVFANEATLRTHLGDGLTNSGTMTFASGKSRVFGRMTNSGSTVVAAGAEATFYDQVTNTGVISASAGAKVTTFGAFKGNGIAGPGAVFLEGPVQPGASPG